MGTEQNYTTQFQAGLGMVPETLSLLGIWQPGMSASQLADNVIEQGVFARTTARRARNIAAEMFAPRYLTDRGVPAQRLKSLLEARVAGDFLSQLFFLHTARAQRIFADFVREIFWPRYAAGADSLSKSDSEQFILRALDAGRMEKRWTESTVRRVSGYLLGCCSDFGLLGPGAAKRPIRRFAARKDTVLYLAYDLHCAGTSDRELVSHSDWELFGLNSREALAELRLLDRDGHLLVQKGGEIVQISWTYKTMEEVIRVLSAR